MSLALGPVLTWGSSSSYHLSCSLRGSDASSNTKYSKVCFQCQFQSRVNKLLCEGAWQALPACSRAGGSLCGSSRAATKLLTARARQAECAGAKEVAPPQQNTGLLIGVFSSCHSWPHSQDLFAFGRSECPVQSSPGMQPSRQPSCTPSSRTFTSAPELTAGLLAPC